MLLMIAVGVYVTVGLLVAVGITRAARASDIVLERAEASLENRRSAALAAHRLATAAPPDPAPAPASPPPTPVLSR
jgi:hypothetical protein